MRRRGFSSPLCNRRLSISGWVGRDASRHRLKGSASVWVLWSAQYWTRRWDGPLWAHGGRAVGGSRETVRARLEAFAQETSADELMVTSQIFNHEARLRSFEIVSTT